MILMLPAVWGRFRSLTFDTWRIGGIFGVFLFLIFSLETWGIAHTTATNAGFLISLCVVFVPVIDALLNRRLPNLVILGAVLLSFVGTGMLTLRAGYSFNLGDILILLAALVRSLFMIYSKKLTDGKNVDTVLLTFVQLGVVAVCTGIVSFMAYPHKDVIFPPHNVWASLIYLSVFCTIYAFYVQLSIIRLSSPARVGLLLGTEPLFAALFGILIGQEHLTAAGWMGGVCILVATWMGRQSKS
jgi:drug/metabolite transporter (DMT)-like permease